MFSPPLTITNGNTVAWKIPFKKPVPISSKQAVKKLKRYAESLDVALQKYAKEERPPLLIIGVKVGSIGFCFGPPKSGKTTYLEYLLLCIAAGRTAFIGYTLQAPNKKTLFVSFEEASWGRLERNSQQLQSFTLEERQSILGNYILSNQEMPRFITEEGQWKMLEDEIAFHQPGVVVIDSLSRLTLESNGEEEVAKLTMKRLREICDQYKITLFVINHTPKGANERPLTFSSMSGSRIFAQEADFLFGVNRTITNKRYIKLVFSRYDRDDSDTVDAFVINEHQCIDLTEKSCETDLLREYDSRIDTSNSDALLREMHRIAEEKQMQNINAEELKFLYEEGTMAKMTFYNNLNKLIEKGIVNRLPGKGKYQLVS